MTYDDLFHYIHQALHERTGKFITDEMDQSDLARACSGDLEITRAFAFEHHIDIEALAAMLWNAGAVCDCELLTVARNRISGDEPLPELAWA